MPWVELKQETDWLGNFYPQPAELLDKSPFPTMSWFIKWTEQQWSFWGEQNTTCFVSPFPVWGAAARGPLCPLPEGCPGSSWIPRWKSPLLPAALTQQPAPPWEREAKWIQDPHGLMESQAQPGFAQRFSSFPSCLMCVGTFYSSASCTHRFFISSPFLGLPTYITLRGSFLWCSQRDTKMKEAHLGKKQRSFPSLLFLPSEIPHKQSHPAVFWRAFMGNTAQRKPQVVFILSHMVVHKGKGWQKSLALCSGAAAHTFSYQIMQ